MRKKSCNSIDGERQGSIQALVVNEKDNVATSIIKLNEKDSAIIQFSDGSRAEIVVFENIPKYHKFALCDIPRGEAIIKYGYIIGRSKEEIKKGKHVHIHNTISEQEAKVQ